MIPAMLRSKNLAAAAVFAGIAAGAAAAHASDAMKAVVSSYLEIHAQLAADKIDGVPPAADRIVAEAGELPATERTAIVSAARAVRAASDLSTARERFGPLSDAVIAAARKEGWNDLGVKLGYCPMLKRSWLQKEEKEIRNPYGMLTCGVLK